MLPSKQEGKIVVRKVFRDKNDILYKRGKKDGGRTFV